LWYVDSEGLSCAVGRPSDDPLDPRVARMTTSTTTTMTRTMITGTRGPLVRVPLLVCWGMMLDHSLFRAAESRRRPKVPIRRSRAPRPPSQGRASGAPVKASAGVLEVLASVDTPPVDPLSVDPLPVDPSPVDPSDDDDALAGVVVVVVEPVQVVVVVVVVVAEAAVNVTATVHPVIESVVSSAVSVTVSGVVSVTSKMAFPLLSEVEVAVVVAAWGSALATMTWDLAMAALVSAAAVVAVTWAVLPDAVSVTDLPVTGSPLASRNSTVITAAVFPSPATLVELAVTVESAMVGTTGGGVPNVTATSWFRGSASVESVAV